MPAHSDTIRSSNKSKLCIFGGAYTVNCCTLIWNSRLIPTNQNTSDQPGGRTFWMSCTMVSNLSSVHLRIQANALDSSASSSCSEWRSKAARTAATCAWQWTTGRWFSKVSWFQEKCASAPLAVKLEPQLAGSHATRRTYFSAGAEFLQQKPRTQSDFPPQMLASPGRELSQPELFDNQTKEEQVQAWT